MNTHFKEFISSIKSDVLDEEMKEFLEAMENDPDAEGIFEALSAKKEKDDSEKANEAQAIFKDVELFFVEKGWRPQLLDGDDRVIMTGFQLRNFPARVMIVVEKDSQSIRINSTLPIVCEEGYRMILGSYLTELNQDLRYGGFHLDKEDGEVTYRYTYSYMGDAFNKEKFDMLLNACLITPDINYRKISHIATGKLAQEEKLDYFKQVKRFASAISKEE